MESRIQTFIKQNNLDNKIIDSLIELINKLLIDNKINNLVLGRIQENISIKELKIIKELKVISPQLSDTDLLLLYNKSISIHQSKIQGNGDFLENDILVNILDSIIIN